MERINENINGINYTFHISTENNQNHVGGFIKLLNNEESFRRLEKPELLLKRILYYNIYLKLDKYLIVKTATVETDTEFQAIFEVVDFRLKKELYVESILMDSGSSINVAIKVLDAFTDCDKIIETPLGINSRILIEENSLNIINLFKIIVFNMRIEDSENDQNYAENLMFEKAIKKFSEKIFGDTFLLVEREKISCNRKEIQIKFTIIPNGF